MNNKDLIVYFSIDLQQKIIKQCNIKTMVNTSFKDFFDSTLNNNIISDTKEEYNETILLDLLKKKNASKTFNDKDLKKQYVFDINSFDNNLVYCTVYLIRNNTIDSSIDYLTGIYNRAFLTKEFGLRVRENKFKTCALVLIDLNNFKNVNDYFGHRVGDKVLREFTNSLARTVDGNFFGRYGGDEFIVFLENPSVDHIKDICKSILEISIDHENEEHKIRVSCCVGVTVANIDEAQFEYLLEKADRALYKAKQAGKNAAYLDDECLVNLKPKKALKKKRINKKFRLLNQEISYTNKKYFIVSLLVMLIFIGIFVPTIITLRKESDNTNLNEASSTMSMLSEELEEKINTNVELYFLQLESLSKIVTQELNDSKSEEEILNANVSSIYFESIGILHESGDALFSAGLYNIAQERIAEEIIINKKPYIDDIYFNFIGEYIIVGIPYTNQHYSNIVGLCGVINKEEFSSFLKTNVFEGKTKTLITKSDGTIISNSLNYDLSYKNINNIFQNSSMTYEQAEKILTSGGKETIRCKIDNVESILFFTSLKLNNVDSNINWNIAIYTPTSAINQYTVELFSNFVYLFTGVAAFIIVIATIFLSMLKYFKNKLMRTEYIDIVTDGINLKRFNIDGEKLIKRYDDYALVISDIVRFKYINEQLGRQVTDVMLKQIYDILLNDSSEYELVSRVYGDRFIMLFNNNNIKSRIENINNKIYEFIKKEYGLNITTLYGIYSPNAKIDGMYYASNMARIALKDLKSNKQSSIIEFYSKEMYLEELSQIEIEQKFESAIRNHEFLVYYQAKRDIRNEVWNSSEALVRWQDSNGVIIPPGKFISIFEENGYITTLDLYIFETVCSDLKKDINRGIKPLPVSVNLSKKHLIKENFIDDFAKILKSYNIPSSLIEFEFTESIAIENDEELKKVINQIHNLGCKCSIDDFGTGYSSLSMLANFKFDVIKLDRSFFYKKEAFTETDKLIVKSVIDLAHNLNKTVVAEGIEELEMVNFLKECNCDYIQGYYYAKPIDRINFLTLTEK